MKFDNPLADIKVNEDLQYRYTTAMSWGLIFRKMFPDDAEKGLTVKRVTITKDQAIFDIGEPDREPENNA